MLNKQFKSTAITLLLGELIEFLILSSWLKSLDEIKRFDELALGKYTSTLFVILTTIINKKRMRSICIFWV
jgi:pilus assembly protein TadC